jgi:putative oxidoreductase
MINRNSQYISPDKLLLIARLLIVSLFVFSGLEKLFDYSGAVAYASSHGIPLASIGMPLAIGLELICATMLLLGWHARGAALLLMVWALWTGPWFHRFWIAPPAMWQFMIDDFFHHLVMAGGLLYVYVFGAGRIALEGATPTQSRQS